MKYESSYLSHHGIKGQQWGVRRFQNDDGTLTEEGRVRYNVGDRRSSGIGSTVAFTTALATMMSAHRYNSVKKTRSKVKELDLNSNNKKRISEDNIQMLATKTRKNRNRILDAMKKDPELSFEQAWKNENKRAMKKALMNIAAASAMTVAVISAPKIRNSVLRNKAVQQLIKRAKYRKMNAVVLKKNEWQIDMPTLLTRG